MSIVGVAHVSQLPKSTNIFRSPWEAASLIFGSTTCSRNFFRLAPDCSYKENASLAEIIVFFHQIIQDVAVGVEPTREPRGHSRSPITDSTFTNSVTLSSAVNYSAVFLELHRELESISGGKPRSRSPSDFSDNPLSRRFPSPTSWLSILVAGGGFAPPTFRVWTCCSTWLSYPASYWWVVMVTLHEATSSLNYANGFTVRRDGHHPKNIMVSVVELESTTHAPKARVSPSTPYRENLQRAGNQIRTDDTYSAERYVSNYTIPALCRLKWRPIAVPTRWILLDREVWFHFINGAKQETGLLLTAIVRIMVCCMFPKLARQPWRYSWSSHSELTRELWANSQFD